MTYVPSQSGVTNPIQASDFNGIVENGYSNGTITLDAAFNAIWGFQGAGAGIPGGAEINSAGYGQSPIPTVTAEGAPNGYVYAGGTDPTSLHQQWARLSELTYKVSNHTGVVINRNDAFPTTGNEIKYQLALLNNINLLYAGRLNAVRQGTPVQGIGQRTTPWGGGQTRLYTQVQVPFASVNAAYYFFNGGGTVNLTFDLSTNTAIPQNNAWYNLINDLGTLVLPASQVAQQIGGLTTNGLTYIAKPGYPLNPPPSTHLHYGFYELSSTPTTLYYQADTGSGGGAYASNYVDIRYSWNAGSATLYIDIYMEDDHQNPDVDYISGTLTVTATAVQPYLDPINGLESASWGNPSPVVSTPTVIGAAAVPIPLALTVIGGGGGGGSSAVPTRFGSGSSGTPTGGAAEGGGGGGGGSYTNQTNAGWVQPLFLSSTSDYALTVGGGGSGGPTPNSTATNGGGGGASSFGLAGVPACGGGGGGGAGNRSPGGGGVPGGSPGGQFGNGGVTNACQYPGYPSTASSYNPGAGYGIGGYGGSGGPDTAVGGNRGGAGGQGFNGANGIVVVEYTSPNGLQMWSTPGATAVYQPVEGTWIHVWETPGNYVMYHIYN